METKSVSAEEVLGILSDKAHIAQMDSLVAIQRRGKWFIGRLTVSAGPVPNRGLVGNKDSEGFIELAKAEKMLILD
jgi:hypothetical protein